MSHGGRAKLEYLKTHPEDDMSIHVVLWAYAIQRRLVLVLVSFTSAFGSCADRLQVFARKLGL
jgi:hypothetical protein